MRRIIKGLLWIVFSLIPIAIVASILGYVWLARSVAPATGEISLADLSGPVTITRDKNAVPHISGNSIDDVLMALGFVHAQERLWQMEMNRMAGQGRLSEIFGDKTISTDRFIRSIGLYESAESSLASLGDPDRQKIEAYVRGINAFIASPGPVFGAKYSPEFVILGDSPEKWIAADVIVTLKLMSVTLAANIDDEVLRLKFARLGMSDAEITDLLPPVPGDAPPPLPDLRQLLGLSSGTLKAGAIEAEKQFASLNEIMGSGASNNWVVGGARTESGKPILANDPHLGLTSPGIWYLAHLQVKNSDGTLKNLVGVTLPGAPLVLLGRNDKVAWGFTNTGADVQDIFIEKTNPDDPNQYQAPEGFRPFEKKGVTIKVKGGDAVKFDRLVTRHGPVLPADYRGLDHYLPEGTVASLSWTALAGDDKTISAGLKLWEFASVTEFQNGMRDFVTPMQSIVIADTNGDIGLIAPGRVPVRDPANQIMGRAPSPGWDATYDWKGFIPYEELPRVYNPADNVLATANTKMVDASYPHFLTFDWDEPWRFERIKTLVYGANQQTLETNRKVQGDAHSNAYAALAPIMLNLVERHNDVDLDVLKQLNAWDFVEDRARIEPLFFNAWLRMATKRIFEDDLGDVFPSFWQGHVGAMLRWLGPNPARDWCDDRRTPEKESCGDVLALALGDAVSDLDMRLGSDRSKWNWGALHYAYGAHRPFSQVSPLDRLFDVTVPASGGAYTLDRGKSSFTDDSNPFRVTHGTSYRGLFDLADLDRSTYIQTSGQSGNVFSANYRDFAQKWANTEAITIPIDEKRYEEGLLGVWRLKPKN
ncbi:penicillin acylase family protein [Phyllobacterium brassicacearum]|uniref:Penicillin acylase family protein n=1 Tax=Phyllobacterium brassicacearum TaxID=314235 RepID=A0A2P7BTH7_9HYPH|nr:penicillin acylase family protein [Phyllobacterium brassicacearum]PSH69760.1 penicillin acylase family protein [Phyllobacterium brassicacearum]TDQ34910.1 penicillin amidase [Phyllobacterium brassicacearum]